MYQCRKTQREKFLLEALWKKEAKVCGFVIHTIILTMAALGNHQFLKNASSFVPGITPIVSLTKLEPPKLYKPQTQVSADSLENWLEISLIKTGVYLELYFIKDG